MCYRPLLMNYDSKERKYIIGNNANVDPNRAVFVPCGKCPACKKSRKANYAVRARAEYQKYGPQRTFMLNLTVNDHCIDKVFPNGSLDHTEFQKFMKRLRKKLWSDGIDVKIKYICGAEYGERNGRPHFHVIVFGWKPDDLKKWSNTKKGFKQFRSAYIEECWKDTTATKEDIENYNSEHGTDLDYLPLGFVTIGEVYDSTVLYVSKYVIKNCDIPKDEFVNEYGEIIRKPYIVFPHEMLGYEWFLENYKQILSLGYCTTKYGKCAVPKNWIKKAQDSSNLDLLDCVDDYIFKKQQFIEEENRRIIRENNLSGIYSLHEFLVEQGREQIRKYNSFQLQNTLNYK